MSLFGLEHQTSLRKESHDNDITIMNIFFMCSNISAFGQGTEKGSKMKRDK